MPIQIGQTTKRKAEHLNIALKKNVQYRKTTGFEDLEFIHNALPEINFDAIDVRAQIFNKRINAPIIILGMTGGYEGAKRINRALAEAAQEVGVAMGIGSQRAMLKNPAFKRTYSVRTSAPDIPLLGNIGIYQVKKHQPHEIEKIISEIDADALVVHINPLQEIIQPEGDRGFSGCLEALERLCSHVSVPVIAKEVGAGISAEVAVRLEAAGVDCIDVSGAGGTSWSGVELARGGIHTEYWDWGIPTAAALADVSHAVSIPLIASGGVRSGLDVAKSIALGASYGAAALPFLKAVTKGGARRVQKELEYWINSLKIAMFLTGSRNLSALANAPVLITGKTAEVMRLRGINPAGYAQR